ncbi:MAG: hypothetical protein FWE52_00625 [Alphaproteobacteria bacterium]|nr:hypothetical protein [Alphaproteobacteria bacterium]
MRVKNNRRNLFNLSHPRVFTMDTGTFNPMLVQRVLPGDVWNVKTRMVVRAYNVPLFPLMHQVKAYTRYFFVPNRLLFDDWETMITGAKDGRDLSVDNITPPTAPSHVYAGTAQAESILDYIGFPLDFRGIAVTEEPLRAIAKVWSDWIRDQNIQPEVDYPRTSGNQVNLNWWRDYFGDLPTSRGGMPRVNWGRDYLTSSVQQRQKGPVVTIPLIGDSPVVTSPTDNSITANEVLRMAYFNGSFPAQNQVLGVSTTGIVGTTANATAAPTGVKPLNLVAKTSLAAGIPVPDVRQGFQTQLLFEINMDGGNRYTEHLRNLFNVIPPDSRLQRAEFLGGGQSPVIFREVLQTSETSGDQPLGQLGGHGFTAQETHEFTKSFVEDGWVLGFIYIRPKGQYQQSLSRHFTKLTRFDHYIPVFAHLSQQPVYKYEVDATQGRNPNAVFGYQDVWDEYRHILPSVHGLVKTNLDFFAWQRVFSNEQSLNSDFIQCRPGGRPFKITDQSPWVVEMMHHIKALRPMPKRGTSGRIDHA